MKKRTYYELTSSQETMYYLILFTMHTQAAAIPFYFKLEKELDLNVLCRAAELEFERNDALRLRFCGSMLKPKQYFINEAEHNGKIRIVDFYGRPKEEDEFFKKESFRPFKYRKGDTVRIVLCKTAEGKTGIYIDSFHLITDAYGVLTTVNDILAVYNALKTDAELPPPPESFEEKIKAEHELIKSEQMDREREIAKKFLSENGEPFFAAPWGMERLRKERKKKKDPTLRTYSTLNLFSAKSGLYNSIIDGEKYDRLIGYCKTTNVSPSALLTLGYRIYCSAVNERNRYVALGNVLARRRTKKDKNLSGCLVMTSIMGRELFENESFALAADKLSFDMMRSMRYSDMPYAEQVEFLPNGKNYAIGQGLPMMFLSYIPHSGVFFGGEKYTVSGFNTGYFGIELYVLAVQNMDKGTIDCEYIHKLANLPEWNIRELHENAIRIIEAGIDNPEITVGELLDLVESKHINK